MSSARLTRRFFRRDPVTLAKALLGQTLVRVLDDGAELTGRIVEVEAYLGQPDRAAHTFGGRRTARNASMWLDAGHAYVYFTYGMHFCMNITADGAEVPTACLIRALEPAGGLDVMRRLRSGKIDPARLRDVDLCSGPAKLAQALAIDRTLDGEDLTNSPRIYLRRGRPLAADQIVASPRIGVSYAKEWAQKPLRFHDAASPHISKK
ncbi:DNA-3-methyladenine glycosylase [Planctomycetales bacterium ZRK34]|nr:DNA-3-methyladenine glycosylase [Planctomycetales bacterium ZRK34]